jgi:serine/threonine protein kinase
LTDFGISQRLKLGESCNQTSGTPSYMAPEILYCQDHSYTSDYYSLGLITYECIYGYVS